MAKEAKPKKPHASAYKWTPEIEDEIFLRIGEGESLRKICDDDWLPSRETVHKRIVNDAAFADQYARARETQADTLVDQILEIADTPLIGTKTKTTANGVRQSFRQFRFCLSFGGICRPSGSLAGRSKTTVHPSGPVREWRAL